MIGAFARMFGSQQRVVSVEPTEENGYAVTARGPSGDEIVAATADAPPPAFSERVSHEGGDVYLVPLIEQLRVWWRKGRTTDSAASENSEEEGTSKGDV